jgi:IS30 family transposase
VEKISNRVDIEERPTFISERECYEDWEEDFIQERAIRDFLFSVYERKSCTGKLYLLPAKSSLRGIAGFHFSNLAQDQLNHPFN